MYFSFESMASNPAYDALLMIDKSGSYLGFLDMQLHPLSQRYLPITQHRQACDVINTAEVHTKNFRRHQHAETRIEISV